MSKEMTDFMESFVVMQSLMGKKLDFRVRKSSEIDCYRLFDGLEPQTKRKVSIKRLSNEICNIMEFKNSNSYDITFTLSTWGHKEMLESVKAAPFEKKVDKMGEKTVCVSIKLKSFDDFVTLFSKLFPDTDLAI
jgi:hypothetical protein